MIRLIEHPEDPHTPVYRESPDAPVKLVDKQTYWNWEVIRCPYCEGTHVHGGIGKRENPLEFLGGRMAHCSPEDHVSWEIRDASPCWNGDAEYRLIPVDGNPTADELDQHFPSVLDTPLDAYHVSKWTESLDHNSAYRRYQAAAKRAAPGNVYLLEAGGRYKIGVAGDLQKRIDSIATSCPFPIEIIHSVKVPHPYELENRLHVFCSSERVHREWFALDDNLVEQVIRKMASAWMEGGAR